MELFKILGVIDIQDKDASRVLQGADKAAHGLGKTLDGVSKAIKPISVALAGLATAAVAAGLKVDDAMDKIRISTGKTGAELKKLEDNFKNVFKNVPNDAMEVADAMTLISQRTGATGKALEDLTTYLLEFANISGSNVKTLTETLTTAFNNWGIATDKQVSAMDWLYKVAQQTVGMDGLGGLLETVTRFAPQMRAMGLSFEQSSALIGQLEKAGVNTESVMSGLTKALNTLSKEGITNTDQALAKMFTNIQNGGDATQYFGKAGVQMADAIRSGRLSIDDFTKALQKNSDTIGQTYKDTAGLQENIKTLKNNLTLALEPLGTALLDVFNSAKPIIDQVVFALVAVMTAFASLTPEGQKFVLVIGGLIIALPILSGILNTMGTAFTTLKAGLTSITASFTSAGAAMREYIDLQQNAPTQIAQMRQEMQDLAMAYWDNEQAIDTLVPRQQELLQMQEDLSAELSAYDPMQWQYESTAANLEHLEGELGNVTGQIDHMRQENGRLRESFTALDAQVTVLETRYKASFGNMLKAMAGPLMTIGALSMTLYGLIEMTGLADTKVGAFAATLLKWLGIITMATGALIQMVNVIKASLIPGLVSVASTIKAAVMPALTALAALLGISVGWVIAIIAAVAALIAGIVILVRHKQKDAEATGKQVEMNKKLKKTIDDNIDSMNKELGLIALKQKVYGNSYNAFADRATVLRNTIDDLLKKGIDPASGTIQRLKKQLDLAEQGADAMNRQATQMGGTMTDLSKIEIPNFTTQLGKASTEISRQEQFIKALHDATKEYGQVLRDFADIATPVTQKINSMTEAWKGFLEQMAMNTRKAAFIPGYDELEGQKKIWEDYRDTLLSMDTSAPGFDFAKWEEELRRANAELERTNRLLAERDSKMYATNAPEGFMDKAWEFYGQLNSELDVINAKYEAGLMTAEERGEAIADAYTKAIEAATEAGYGLSAAVAQLIRERNAASGLNPTSTTSSNNGFTFNAGTSAVFAALDTAQTMLLSGLTAGTQLLEGDWIGAIVELIKNTESFARIVGSLQGVIDAVLSIVDIALKPIVDILVFTVDTVSDVIGLVGEILSPIMGAVGAVFDPLIEVVETLMGVLEPIVDLLNAFLKPLEPIITVFVRLVSLPIMLIVKAFGGLGKAIQLVTDFIDKTFGALVRGIVDFWNGLMDALASFTVLGWKPFEGMLDWKINLNDGAIEDLKDSIADALRSGVDNGLKDGIKKFLSGSDANEWQKSIRDGIRNTVIDALAQAVMEGALFKGAMGSLLEKLTMAMATGNMNAIMGSGGILAQIKAALPAIYQNISTVLGDMPQWLSWALSPSDPAGVNYSTLEPVITPGGGATVSQASGNGITIQFNNAQMLSPNDMEEYMDAMVDLLRQKGIV